MNNKEILEEMRKENQERKAREKRYKVRKVEHYTEELCSHNKNVLVGTIVLGFLSVLSAFTLGIGFSPIEFNVEIKNIMRFSGV